MESRHAGGRTRREISWRSLLGGCTQQVLQVDTLTLSEGTHGIELHVLPKVTRATSFLVTCGYLRSHPNVKFPQSCGSGGMPGSWLACWALWCLREESAPGWLLSPGAVCWCLLVSHTGWLPRTQENSSPSLCKHRPGQEQSLVV